MQFSLPWHQVISAQAPATFGLFLPNNDTLCFECRFWCANNSSPLHFLLYLQYSLLWLQNVIAQEPANRSILLFIHDALCFDSDYWWADNRCPWYIALYPIYSLLSLKDLKGHGNDADFLRFLQKLVPHRSLTLPFEPFRFWLRIRKMTLWLVFWMFKRKLGESESQLCWGVVANSPARGVAIQIF